MSCEYVNAFFLFFKLKYSCRTGNAITASFNLCLSWEVLISTPILLTHFLMIVIWVESLSSFRTWNASFRPSDFRSFCLTAKYSKVRPLYMSILSFLAASKIFSLFCFCSVLTLWHGGRGGGPILLLFVVKKASYTFHKGSGKFSFTFCWNYGLCLHHGAVLRIR